MSRTVIVVLVCGLLLLAGCAGGGSSSDVPVPDPSNGTTTTASATATTTSADATAVTPTARTTGPAGALVSGLAFKTDYEEGARPVVVSFHTSREATLGVGVFTAGRFVGNTSMRQYGGETYDAGGKVSFRESLKGTHTLRAVVYRDDGDGRFERGADAVVTRNGSAVSTTMTMEFLADGSE